MYAFLSFSGKKISPVFKTRDEAVAWGKNKYGPDWIHVGGVSEVKRARNQFYGGGEPDEEWVAA